MSHAFIVNVGQYTENVSKGHDNPHINIRRPSGTEVRIDIEGLG
jgi:hypothetical protein